MEKHICPLCNDYLSGDTTPNKHTDYSCVKSADHYYAKRIKNDELTKIKFRLTDPDGKKLYIKINYDQGITQVWTKSNNNIRSEIQSVFEPDFSDIEKLKNKLKTYLVFS